MMVAPSGRMIWSTASAAHILRETGDLVQTARARVAPLLAVAVAAIETLT